MSSTISIVLVGLWLLGMTIPYTLHGYLHLLPASAVAVAIISVFFKKRGGAD
jgi:hypothetical protein